MPTPWYDLPDERLGNEHPIPPRAAQHPLPNVPVRARLEWADGIEQLDTVAYGYAGRLVLVQVVDARRRTIGAWLDVDDAPRR